MDYLNARKNLHCPFIALSTLPKEIWIPMKCPTLYNVESAVSGLGLAMFCVDVVLKCPDWVLISGI